MPEATPVTAATPAVEANKEAAVAAAAAQSDTKEKVTDGAPAAAEPEKKDEALSPRFAALARKEKAAWKAISEAKTAKAELAREREELAKLKGEAAAKKPENPIQALMNAGYSYKDATDFILNNERLTPEQQLKAVEAKIDGKLSELEKREQARLDDAKRTAEQENQRIVDEFKEECRGFVEQNADKYELTMLHGQTHLVYDTIAAYYDKNQKVLSVEEAAGLVEKYLENLVETTLKAKKVQGRLKPKEEPKPDPKQEGAKTLTNSMSGSGAGFLPARSEEERLQRALARLNGQA